MLYELTPKTQPNDALQCRLLDFLMSNLLAHAGLELIRLVLGLLGLVACFALVCFALLCLLALLLFALLVFFALLCLLDFRCFALQCEAWLGWFHCGLA